MEDQDEVEITEVLDDEFVEQPEEEDDDAEGETPDSDESEPEGDDSDDDSVVVSIGGEPVGQDEDFNGKPAPKWVKELREQNREKDRLIRELQAKASPPAKVDVGKEPELADFDYDEPKFKDALRSYLKKKDEADDQEKKAREKQEADSRAWQNTLDDHSRRAKAFKVPDYDAAKAAVEGAFNPMQVALMIQAADASEVVEYALGSNPKKLKELAAIENPVKFAAAVAKLETQLKVQPRKTAPIPEKTVRGSAPVSGTTNAKLARLEQEAEKTGDRSKLIAYKKSLGK